MEITHEWRGDFDNAELNALHAEAFDHRLLDDDWKAQYFEACGFTPTNAGLIKLA